VGWRAPTGITAGFLAHNGFTGAPAFTCQGPHWAGLGTSWKLVSDTHYKPYPCCRWSHPSIDVAAELMRRHDLSYQEIASVEIRAFHNATRLAGHSHLNADEFAYSIAFPVACMIVRGQVGIPELDIAALKDPDILRISAATRLFDDPHLTQVSDGKRWAQVSIIMQEFRINFTFLRILYWDLKLLKPSKISAPNLTIWTRLGYKAYWISFWISRRRRCTLLTYDCCLGASISFK